MACSQEASQITRDKTRPLSTTMRYNKDRDIELSGVKCNLVRKRWEVPNLIKKNLNSYGPTKVQHGRVALAADLCVKVC